MNYRINLSKQEQAFVKRRLAKFYDQAQRNPNRNLACPFGLHLKRSPKIALSLEDKCLLDGNCCICNIVPGLDRGPNAMCPCCVYGKEEALRRLKNVIYKIKKEGRI